VSIKRTLYPIWLVGIVGLVACSGDVETRDVDGNISFSNQTPAVTAHLAADPAIDGSSVSVSFYRPGTVVASARSGYTAVNSGGVTGTYSISPEVENDADVFNVEVRNIAFQSGAFYVMGSRYASSAALQQCGPIPSGGGTCNLSECARVVNVTVKVVGDQEDLDGLEGSGRLPVGTGVIAAVAGKPRA